LFFCVFTMWSAKKMKNSQKKVFSLFLVGEKEILFLKLGGGGGDLKQQQISTKTPWYHIPEDSILTDPEISTKI